MSEQLLTKRLNPYPKGSNDALLWVAGLARRARAFCPICNKVFDALSRQDDPNNLPVGNMDAAKGRRITCSMACDRVETERVLRPELARALERYERAIESERKQRLEDENKRLLKRLKKAGDF